MKPLKSKVSISLDDDIIRVTKELADADDRTLSSYINLVLKKHIKSYLRESTKYGKSVKLDLSGVTFLDEEE